MGTGATPEHGLTVTVGLLTVATLRARATRVPRVDWHDWYAGLSCFVFDEAPQLPEGPAALPVALATANRDPRADVRQVFDCNPSLRVLSGPNDPFTDHVIVVTPEAGLPSRERLQAFRGAATASALQTPAISMVASTDALDGLSSVVPAVRVGRQIHDPEVDPEEVGGLNGRALRQVNTGIEIEHAVPKDEIDLTFDAVEPLALVLAVDHRDADATRQGHQADLRGRLDAQDPLVVCDRAIWPEDGTAGVVALEGFSRLPDGAHGQLCRQAESLSEIPITSGMDRLGGEHAGLEAHACGRGGGGIEGVHGLADRLSLIRGRHEAQLQGQLHVDYSTTGGGASSAGLKPAVSAPKCR